MSDQIKVSTEEFCLQKMKQLCHKDYEDKWNNGEIFNLYLTIYLKAGRLLMTSYQITPSYKNSNSNYFSQNPQKSYF